MKIAILCHMHHPIAEPYQGGTEAHTAVLAEALVARGHDVTLFAKAGSATAATVYPLVPAEFEFVRFASAWVRHQQRGFLAEAVLHSIEAISTGDFDVVLNASLSSLPYRFMGELPMLTVLHTPPTLDDVTSIVTNPDWQPSPLHRYVTVSHSNADGWRALLPQVDVVYNGIDLDQWTPSGSARPRTAVWAARITPEKGLDVAIDAALLAGVDIEFAGPIAHEKYFAAEIEPRLGASVRYRGHLSHSSLREFLGSGSVFVASPLWEEPFGLSTVEALACGTPVAALPHGALPEIVTPDAGAVAAAPTAEALAAAIPAAERVPRTSARRSATHFSVDAMVDGYEERLRELAALSIDTATDADRIRA